jgi:hypothetical protein
MVSGSNGCSKDHQLDLYVFRWYHWPGCHAVMESDEAVTLGSMHVAYSTQACCQFIQATRNTSGEIGTAYAKLGCRTNDLADMTWLLSQFTCKILQEGGFIEMFHGGRISRMGKLCLTCRALIYYGNSGRRCRPRLACQYGRHETQSEYQLQLAIIHRRPIVLKPQSGKSEIVPVI